MSLKSGSLRTGFEMESPVGSALGRFTQREVKQERLMGIEKGEVARQRKGQGEREAGSCS